LPPPSAVIKKQITTIMAIVRFSVSLEQNLVDAFDQKIKAERCPTRSKAVGDLIRDALVRNEWQAGKETVGAIVLVYDHHKRDIMQKLTEVQHDCHEAIISTQHIHLDHDNCMEIVAVRGKPKVIDAIVKGLKAVKGLKHVSVAAGTTGTSLP
jgi:CopG family nickel-responsive transcriptional regulator